MTEPNIDIVIDCADPETLAEFWADALGYTKVGFFDPYFVLLDGAGNVFARFSGEIPTADLERILASVPRT